jgi:hypothetical protein
MPLVSSGPISHTMIMAEWGIAAGTEWRLSTDGGPLINFPSGAPMVKESDWYGLSASDPWEIISMLGSDLYPGNDKKASHTVGGLNNSSVALQSGDVMISYVNFGGEGGQMDGDKDNFTIGNTALTPTVISQQNAVGNGGTTNSVMYTGLMAGSGTPTVNVNFKVLGSSTRKVFQQLGLRFATTPTSVRPADYDQGPYSGFTSSGRYGGRPTNTIINYSHAENFLEGGNQVSRWTPQWGYGAEQLAKDPNAWFGSPSVLAANEYEVIVLPFRLQSNPSNQSPIVRPYVNSVSGWGSSVHDASMNWQCFAYDDRVTPTSGVGNPGTNTDKSSWRSIDMANNDDFQIDINASPGFFVSDPNQWHGSSPLNIGFSSTTSLQANTNGPFGFGPAMRLIVTF